MTPDPSTLWALAAVGLLVVAAAAWSGLLRWARLPGGAPAAAIVGGIIAGLLLGRTTLGRAAPDVHERMLVGGGDERARLMELRDRHREELAALAAVGVTGIAAEERIAEQRAEAAPIESAWRDAAAQHASTFHLAGAACATLLLLSAPLRAVGRPRPAREPVAAWIAAGAASFLLCAVPAGLLFYWIERAPVGEAGVFGLACGVAGCAVGLRARSLGAPRPPRANDFAVVAGLILSGLVATTMRLPWLGGALLLTGAALWLRLRLGCPRRSLRRLARFIALSIAAPALAALAAREADLLAAARSSAFWIPLAIGVVLSSDGRWLGGWLGWWAMGSPSARAEAWRRSAAMLAAEPGVVQTAVVAWAIGVGAMAPVVALACVIGAAAVELTAGARRAAASILDAAEAPDAPA